MLDKSYRRNVDTWKQVKKNTRTVASYNDITKHFSKLKGWPLQSLINQSLLRKSVTDLLAAIFVAFNYEK